MKKLDPTEQALNRLADLRAEADDAKIVSELRNALKQRSNLVVAKAAKLASDLRLAALVPDMAHTFERLMTNPLKLDKRCAAVTELVTALYNLDYAEPDIYFRGIMHVQKEASFGPPVDEAAKLRAQCALGLLRTCHPDALPKVADLLADPEAQARIGAIRALGTNGGEPGEMLLRYKARTGDPDPLVLSECFTALLEANFSRSLPLIAEFANSANNDVATSAIFALGSQPRVEAFTVLKQVWEGTPLGEIRQTLLTAMAMARLDEAADFLIGLLVSVPVPVGVQIIRALGAYHRDDRVRTKLIQTLDHLRIREFSQEFATNW